MDELNDPNRAAFLKSVMNARTLQGVEDCMDHYDRLINQIARLEKSDAYWRSQTRKLRKGLIPLRDPIMEETHG